MSFTKLATERFSVRKYKDTPVEKEKILSCLEAARLTPSACNSQPWHFVVVDNPAEVAVLAEKTTLPLSKLNQFVKDSTVIVAIVAEKPNLSSGIGGMIKKKPYYLMDIGMTAEHFCLQAAEEGLGTCMLGWFNEKAVKEYLSVPKARSIPLLITLGYPEKETAPQKIRAELEDIHSFGKYVHLDTPHSSALDVRESF